MLRGVGPKAGSRYSTHDGWIVWAGNIDVAPEAIEDGAEVALLYHRDRREWREVDAEPTADPKRYYFEMWQGLYKSGEGGSSWSQMKIELVPFLRLVDGSRLFDHNAIQSDFGNDVLYYGWGDGRRPFELDADLTICP